MCGMNSIYSSLFPSVAILALSLMFYNFDKEKASKLQDRAVWSNKRIQSPVMWNFTIQNIQQNFQE